MTNRCATPIPAALLAGVLASVQPATFYDLVRDELGCDVDDEAVEAIEQPGDTPDAVAARLRIAGACDLVDVSPDTAGMPRAVRWLPSEVSVDADVSSQGSDDARSRVRDLGWGIVFRVRWTLLSGGAR